MNIAPSNQTAPTQVCKAFRTSVKTEFICEVCSTRFRVYPADIRKGGGKCCSVVCRNRRLASRNKRPIEESFWEKVQKTDGCWVWTGGGKTNDGYGQLHRNGTTVRAPRLSWRIHFGQIPEGHHVLHRCDNPACVRPDHLFTGTDADNMADSRLKGRHAHGETHGFAKLTDLLVIQIRREYACGSLGQSDLAEKYGVSRGAIQNVVEGTTWRHLILPSAQK